MRRVVLMAVLLSVAGGLAACGDTGSGSSATVDTAALEERRRREEREERARKIRERRAAAYESCSSTLGRFQLALGELDSRLSVGLNYEAYGTAVADVQVAYDRIEFGALSEYPVCLAIGAMLERAFNQYLRAAGTWQDCFDDIYCDNDSITGSLQGRWANATRYQKRADARLEGLAP